MFCLEPKKVKGEKEKRKKKVIKISKSFKILEFSSTFPRSISAAKQRMINIKHLQFKLFNQKQDKISLNISPDSELLIVSTKSIKITAQKIHTQTLCQKKKKKLFTHLSRPHLSSSIKPFITKQIDI